jgi:Glycosyl transferase family 2
MNDSCNWICLTPTRNEACIIKQFLAAASCWASHIIVADQGSTDGTLNELQSNSRVGIVINPSSTYDELYRQRLLLDRARQINGKRILLALDADEALSSNCVTSNEWERISEAEPGTVLRLRWVNILPGFKKAWISQEPIACGFIDDGSEHTGTRIHTRRIPWPVGAPVIDLHDIVVLHFQYVLWERMVSKQRWYQAWEFAMHRQKTPLQIFREYNHMAGSWTPNEIHPVKPDWLAGYDRVGINFRSMNSEAVTWWDREIVQMLREHGPQHFRKVAIWDKDWTALAATIGSKGVDLADPRSAFERIAHRLLMATQKHRSNWGVIALEHYLRISGW